MKAIVYHKYGSPDVLELEEVEKPTPRDDEVLVEVHGASINAWDWDLLRGRPLLARLTLVLHKPNYDLAFMIELFEAGKVVPVIDRRYPLSEVPEAFRYFGEGHAQGKVVITV